ncbi:MAG TPA: branched-chain-amino-acid transaminase [Candidatus Brocadiia bacterium]|nr:branched-chain-amino-acid transaminase [Candidatus Brocadiales bacterium]
MGLKVYINGELIPQEDAKISVFDHGLLYGDGVFEGIRSYNGNVFKLTAHIDRLYESAKALALNIPMTKDEMKAAIKETLEANNLKDSYIRLVVTRGIGKLGLDPYKCARPEIIIITDTIELYPKKFYNDGLEVVTVATVRNHPEAVDPRIKCLNYINNILAKIECLNAGAMEAVMLNRDGFVAECAGDNIFIIKEGILYTPPSYAGILKGITRDVIIELALEKGMVVKEELFTRYDLYVADECFLSGTAAELIPVVKIDGRLVGTGKPGKITMDLLKRYQDLTRNSITE